VTLAEALNIVRNAPSEAGSFDVMLACGFTPLHLRTYLCAHLQQRLPQRSVRVGAGLYGDMLGTLERISGEFVHALAITWNGPTWTPVSGIVRLEAGMSLQSRIF